MRHTVFTDYSLRVLMYVGVHEGQLVTIDEISKIYDISRNHLTKVVHQLGVEGFIKTIRGRNGGIRLAMAPKDIVIGDLVSKMEEDFELVECFNGNKNKCIISEACKLRSVLGEALDAYMSVLEKYTLADVIENQTRLQKILARAV